MKMYVVGGFVRDQILGTPSKDLDYSVEADSFKEMHDTLVEEGFEIFLEHEEYGTIRARFPKNDPRIAGLSTNCADFVLCRKDGFYSDGRRPDSVEPGTLFDDLARRDFTVNAIAIDESGDYIDPHGGIKDIEARVIRTVGAARIRFSEDYLRVLRALRFTITKGFMMAPSVSNLFYDEEIIAGVAAITHERRREELGKMFAHDTLLTMRYLRELPESFTEASFSGLNLMPTRKGMG